MKCPFNNKLMVGVSALLINKDFERKLYELMAKKDFDGLYNQWNRVVSECADYDHLLLKIVNPKEYKPTNTFDGLATGAANILKSL